MGQAGVNSAVTDYLKAVDTTGTDEAKAVVAQMNKTPINDFFANIGHIREDGRMIHDMYLLQVKSPGKSGRTTRSASIRTQKRWPPV